MSRLREKTTATLLIVIFILSITVIAVPVVSGSKNSSRKILLLTYASTFPTSPDWFLEKAYVNFIQEDHGDSVTNVITPVAYSSAPNHATDYDMVLIINPFVVNDVDLKMAYGHFPIPSGKTGLHTDVLTKIKTYLQDDHIPLFLLGGGVYATEHLGMGDQPSGNTYNNIGQPDPLDWTYVLRNHAIIPTTLIEAPDNLHIEKDWGPCIDGFRFFYITKQNDFRGTALTQTGVARHLNLQGYPDLGYFTAEEGHTFNGNNGFSGSPGARIALVGLIGHSCYVHHNLGDLMYDEGKAVVYNAIKWLAPPPIPVIIDIKPGIDPNSINLKSKGVVPVAILTTEDFDAETVDPETVEFAGTGPVRWTICDVDDDGDLDMLFHFKTQDLDLDEDSTEATLIGKTFDEIAIEGTDAVNIVPRGK